VVVVDVVVVGGSGSQIAEPSPAIKAKVKPRQKAHFQKDVAISMKILGKKQVGYGTREKTRIFYFVRQLRMISRIGLKENEV
jgi:hypothetical protein